MNPKTVAAFSETSITRLFLNGPLSLTIKITDLLLFRLVTFTRLGKYGRLGNQLFQIASTIGIANKNKKDDFNFNILKPLPSINLNEVKARQVFQNLIENAYKYRDKNKKSFINIDWEENDDYYQFMVQDNGIGIEKQYHEIIFEAFKKINNRTDSSGIGLFIIKKIITSYGGKIWIESEIGMGTTFYFTILK